MALAPTAFTQPLASTISRPDASTPRSRPSPPRVFNASPVRYMPTGHLKGLGRRLKQIDILQAQREQLRPRGSALVR